MSVAQQPATRDWITARLDPLDPASHAGREDLDATASPEAGVLVGLVERENGYCVLLTKRSENLRRHKGQIAFPGGRRDPGETLWRTALREAHEEVGLDPKFVSLAGLATPHHMGTGFVITPVVGFLEPGFEVEANPHEVAAVFEAPFDFLMDAANYELREREFPGAGVRSFHAISHGEHLIWGATAAMLRALRERLYGAELG